jgi:hypothetical protein
MLNRDQEEDEGMHPKRKRRLFKGFSTVTVVFKGGIHPSL